MESKTDFYVHFHRVRDALIILLIMKGVNFNAFFSKKEHQVQKQLLKKRVLWIIGVIFHVHKFVLVWWSENNTRFRDLQAEFLESISKRHIPFVTKCYPENTLSCQMRYVALISCVWNLLQWPSCLWTAL